MSCARREPLFFGDRANEASGARVPGRCDASWRRGWRQSSPCRKRHLWQNELRRRCHSLDVIWVATRTSRYILRQCRRPRTGVATFRLWNGIFLLIFRLWETLGALHAVPAERESAKGPKEIIATGTTRCETSASRDHKKHCVSQSPHREHGWNALNALERHTQRLLAPSDHYWRLGANP